MIVLTLSVVLIFCHMASCCLSLPWVLSEGDTVMGDSEAWEGMELYFLPYSQVDSARPVPPTVAIWYQLERAVGHHEFSVCLPTNCVGTSCVPWGAGMS